MSTAPDKMLQTMIANYERNTGKTLDAWIALMKKEKLAKHGEIVKALRKPDIEELLSKQAMEPVGSSPQQFAAFLKKDIATWKEVAAAAKVSVE